MGGGGGRREGHAGEDEGGGGVGDRHEQAVLEELDEEVPEEAQRAGLDPGHLEQQGPQRLRAAVLQHRERRGRGGGGGGLGDGDGGGTGTEPPPPAGERSPRDDE